jgi:hypothetical protein
MAREKVLKAHNSDEKIEHAPHRKWTAHKEEYLLYRIA